MNLFESIRFDEAMTVGAAVPFNMHDVVAEAMRQFYGHFEKQLQDMGYSEENPPPPELTLVTWYETRDGRPNLCGKLEWQDKKEQASGTSR